MDLGLGSTVVQESVEKSELEEYYKALRKAKILAEISLLTNHAFPVYMLCVRGKDKERAEEIIMEYIDKKLGV